MLPPLMGSARRYQAGKTQGQRVAGKHSQESVPQESESQARDERQTVNFAVCFCLPKAFLPLAILRLAFLPLAVLKSVLLWLSLSQVHFTFAI